MSIIIVVGSFVKDDNSCDRTLVELVKSMGHSQTRQTINRKPDATKTKNKRKRKNNKQNNIWTK